MSANESANLYNQGPLAELPAGFPFAPDSALYHYAEPTSILLYPYIAGLTVMNDGIAAAVAEHSTFQSQPWNRLFGTLESALTLVFGDEERSLAKARELWSFHNSVQGAHEGVSYSANDGTLQTWVIGSVFKGLEETRRRWSDPLQPPQRQALYEDMKIFGQVFGVPPQLLPPDIDAFDAYWNDTLDGGDFLLRTPVSRAMVQTVFRFRSPSVPSFVSRVAQAVSITSLDRRLQDRANLQPDRLDHRLGRMVDIALHQTYTRLPNETKLKILPACLTAHEKTTEWLGKLSVVRGLFQKAR